VSPSNDSPGELTVFLAAKAVCELLGLAAVQRRMSVDAAATDPVS
jgi:hypothetical protein